MYTIRLADVAQLAHATEAELQHVAALDAIDHGALTLDEQTTPEEVVLMIDALTRARRKRQRQTSSTESP